MVANPSSVLIYVVAGLLIAVWPLVLQRVTQGGGRGRSSYAIWFNPREPDASPKTALALPLGLLAGLLLGSTLIWWRQFQDITLAEAAIYVGVAAISSGLLALGYHHEARYCARVRCGLALSAALVCMVLSFSTGILSSEFVIVTWHHWGAYIGPSELMISGARILYDVPAQYGLGPTALIAAACRENCWIGMHYVVATSILLFSLTIIGIVARLSFRSAGAYLVALLAVIAVCFFWSAYPPLATSPQIAPSVSGMRFLPALLLVAALLSSGRKGLARYWKPAGFLLYALGAAWSPEALFHVTFIWWPYYLWRLSAEARVEKCWAALFRGVIELVAVSLAIVAVMITVYWLSYGQLPNLQLYLASMLFPPGVLPIDPLGPVWFSAMAVFLGLSTFSQSLVEQRDPAASSRSLLVLLLGYAAISYCLGRGHSNNFLNILPFTVLILLVTISSNTRLIARSIASGMLVSLLASLSLFGWSEWGDNIRAGTILEHDPTRVASSFSYGRTSAKIDFEGVNKAITAVRAKSSDPIEIIQENYLPLVSSPGEAWSAYHAPATVYFVPKEWRVKILRRTAQRLRKSGWIIIQRGFLPDWIDDYRLIYKTDEEFDVGSYHVLRFVPRD